MYSIVYNTKEFKILTSVRTETGKRPIVLDIASDQDVSHTVGKLLKFPIRQRKFSFRVYYFHRGQTMTGRLSSNTNTEEGTLTQESGDVRRVEGEVCGAVLVDE